MPAIPLAYEQIADLSKENHISIAPLGAERRWVAA